MRKSNKAEQWARRKAELAAQKPGEVVVRKATRAELRFDKKGRKGNVTSAYVKQARQAGDTRIMPLEDGSWKEYVAFRGGEGGNGWSVPSTLVI